MIQTRTIEWHPMTDPERPKSGEWVLVQLAIGSVCSVAIAAFFRNRSTNEQDFFEGEEGWFDPSECVAWAYLPEPFKE